MKQQTRYLMALITLLAFGVRVYLLDSVPPGWSDDELSNVLVIAQKPLNGDFAVYYTDATGLEALYHALSAVPLVLFGYNSLGVRLLSAVLGTLTVPLTYVVARRLFQNVPVALVAAAALAVSFWSLIYSRVNLRHISMPVLMLVAFFCFWGFLQARETGRARLYALFAGLALGFGFYTYFAARGVPLIMIAFLVWLALFRREWFRRTWQSALLMFGVALVLAVPLVVTLARETGADARVSEVAVPLNEARAGNFAPLQAHVQRTLSMFHADGDDEFLYNIPRRPVFGPLGAIAFWSGVLLALVYSLWPFFRPVPALHRFQAPATFLLLWWLAGITPGFLSVPAASLGHTIVAQSAAYILLAFPLLPLIQVSGRVWSQRPIVRRSLPVMLGLLLVGSVAGRDLLAYFQEWPAQGNVRFLYRADIMEVAGYLAQQPQLTDIAITGLLSGPWDRLALAMAQGYDPLVVTGGGEGVRWYNPQRAIMLQLADAPAQALMGYPVVDTVYTNWYTPVPGETAGGYQLATVAGPFPQAEQPVCFTNGLCWVGGQYDPAQGILDLVWRVDRPVTLPEMPLVSKPPPPDTYDGPRLLVFAQLVDENGKFLAGDDGLWVDPITLQPGDLFMQRHNLSGPAGATVRIGLYDPLTGERILTEAGQDHILLP
jgi:4-amino-4-deoxy-L-arabinose transferase-like glycosyltransferase